MIRLAIERHTGVTGMQVLVMWVERNSLVARQVDALPEPDQMRDPADLLISQTDLIGRGPSRTPESGAAKT